MTASVSGILGVMMDGRGADESWGLLLLIIVMAITVGAGGVWLAYRTLHRRFHKGVNTTMAPYVGTVAIVYGVLLGFTVVVTWEQRSAAEQNVTAEASSLATLYRQTAAMPDAERTELRALLRKYTNTVIGPEWRAQYNGGTSPDARVTLVQIYRALGDQPPAVASDPINQEFLHELTVMVSARNTRTLDANSQMPWLFWLGLIFGGVLLVVIHGFIRMDNRVFHATLTTLVSVFIGLLLFTIYTLDRPLRHPMALTPWQFKHCLEVFDAVDRAG